MRVMSILPVAFGWKRRPAVRAPGWPTNGDRRSSRRPGRKCDRQPDRYRAEINRDGAGGQEVSGSAEDISQLEAVLIVPSDIGTFEARLRVQDDRPDSPGEKDSEIAAELRWRYRF